MAEEETKQAAPDEQPAPAGKAAEPAAEKPAQAAAGDAGERPAGADKAEPAAADKPEPAAADKPEPAAADAAGPAAADAAGPAAGAGEAAAEAPRRGRGRQGRVSPVGVAYVKASFNNTTVSIADTRGNIVSWSSAGRSGFKGSRKSTAFAATVVAQDAARQAVAKGMNEVEVRVQGAGSGRESAIRGIQSSGLNISVIKDVTPVPHNGCRPRKRRRV
jgi:small subunit ribosomal protein S11